MSNSINRARFCVGHLLLAATACGLGLVPSDASAASPKPRTAVVIGDSFSSGEGGRWRGNSFTGIDGGNRAGTDAAALYSTGAWRYYREIPYMSASIANGCNRSNLAPITYLEKHANGYPQGFDKVVNLACSGARTKHLWPTSAGGTSFKGESPQIPRLGNVAAGHDIDLIVIGVGGNDMGFSGVVAKCAEAWIRKHWTVQDGNSCIGEIRDGYLPNLGDVWFNVAKTIQEVRKQMAAVNDNDYRIVLMGYPAIIPRSNGYSYSAGMRRIRNCPFNGPDSDYVDDVVLPKLNSTMEAVAHQEGVDFINLHNAFDRHRLCESGLGSRVTLAQAPTSLNTEWVRYLDTTGLSANALAAAIWKWKGLIDGTTAGYIAGDQGTLSESMHPNVFGQQAIGDCLREYRATNNVVSRAFKCRGGASGHASDMQVELMAAPAMIHSSANAAIPANGSITINKWVSAGNEPGKMMRTELKINHARKGHLKITVRSPSGKVYMIRDINPNDGGGFPPVSKNFFFDAPVETGTWKLKIEDKIAGYSGTFLDWKAYFF